MHIDLEIDTLLARHLERRETAAYRRSLEHSLNQAQPHLSGWMQAARGLAPDDAIIGRAIERRLCATPADAEFERAVLLGMLAEAPDLCTGQSIECALRDTSTESYFLWTALGVWRRAGRPASPAVDNWVASARDPRTLLAISGRRPAHEP